MAINLQKGQRENINAPKFTIGLGWDTNNSSTGSSFDLDASVFILGDNGKILSDSHFIFYNNLKSPDESVIHTGDNLTGDGDGDDNGDGGWHLDSEDEDSEDEADSDLAGNVGDVSATCQFVADLDLTCVSGPTFSRSRHMPNYFLLSGYVVLR